MNMKTLLKPFLICAVLVSGVSIDYVFGQQSEEKPDYSAYYYHRKNLFEQLPNDENEIILLGDSITDGNEWSEMFGIPRLKNRGISGDVTDGVLYRLDEVTESKPDKVFVMIGVNDLARDRSVDYVLENYDKIVNQIEQDSPDTKIYIQSVLPVNEDFEQFSSHVDKTPEIKEVNKGLKKLADQKGFTYIDLFDDMSTEGDQLNPDYTEDGLHLNGEGYLVWKVEIDKYIQQ
jgi:lysophospholipase L1-like esterase